MMAKRHVSEMVPDLYSDSIPVALNDFFSPMDRSSDMGEFEPSLTRQEFADECDINTIMAQYEKHGVITHYSRREPAYLDLSEGVPDLATAMSVLNEATASFMTLPAKVRREFDNDPVKFVAFAENAENIEQLRTWGLAAPAPAPEEPFAVRVVPDAPSPPPPEGGSKPV